jgi:hypothetical protein
MPFPAPAPIRPLFCCTKTTPENQNYISTPGIIESTLQRSRLYNFVTNISAYSLSNGVPVAGLSWSEDSEYLISVLRYQKKEMRKVKRKKRDKWTKRKGKGKGREEKWVQVELGRYFVETRHEKGKRWPDHAFEEVLIVEEAIPGRFRRVEEVGLEVRCQVHGGIKFVCEFWKRE